MSCSIVDVLAPNGEPSLLFQDLLNTVGDPSRALSLYLDLKLAGPGEARVDENGEVRLAGVLNNSGLSPVEVDAFLSHRPDVHSMPAAGPAKESKTRRRRMTLPEEVVGVERMINLTINRIKDARDAAKDSDVKATFTDQLAKLKDQRNRIFWSDTLDPLKKVAEEQLQWAEKIISSRNPSKQSLRLAIDLVNAWSWETTSAFLSPGNDVADSLWAETFSEISEQAHRLTLSVNAAIVKNIQKTMRRSGIEVTTSELTTQYEIGFLRRTLFDLSTVDSKLAQWIDGTLKRAARNQAENLRQISRKLGEMSEGVDQSKLLQRDLLGNLTGNLITPYSAAYLEDLRRAQWSLQIKLDNAARASTPEASDTLAAAAYRTHYSRRRNVDIAIDIRKLRDPASRAAYEQYLVDQLGPDAADNAIDDAERAYTDYLNEKDEARSRFMSEVTGGTAELKIVGGKRELNSEYVERRMKEWEQANSPEQYMSEFYGKGLKQYLSTDGHRFAVHVPRKTNAAGQTTNYYDSAYDNLTEKEREFLDYVLTLSSNLLSYLPSSLTRDLGAGFLPVVQKTLTERVLGNGSWADLDMKGGFDQAREELLSSFVDQQVVALGKQQEKARKTVNPATGDEIRKIPVGFIQHGNVRRKKGESDEAFSKRVQEAMDGRSFDIVRVMEMFAGMSINYHHMSQVEDKVLLAQRIVNEAEEARRRGGSPVYDFTGKLVTRRDGRTHLKDMVQYAIDGMLYGQKRKEDEWVTNTAVYSLNPLTNHKKSRQASEIRRQANLLDQQRDEGTIDEKAYKEARGALEKQYLELNGRRLSVGKSLDNLLKFTQAKGMGWNLTAGIANVGFGVLSNVIHSAANVDFNETELLTATRIMLKARTNPKSKAAAIIKLLDVLFEITEIGYGKNAERAKFKKISWITNPFEVQRRTEFFLQGTSVVAQLLHQKMKDKDGNEVSLWDAFTNEGEWDVEKMGPQPAEWKFRLDSDEQNEFTKTRDRIIGVNKKLHGNYDPNSLVEAKKWVAGRMLLMFRSWMAEGFEWRFAHEHFDQQLGRTIKGRWLSYRDLAREHGAGKTAQLMLRMLLNKKGQLAIEGKPLSELDMQNMRSNIMEIQFYIALTALTVMLKAGLQDDDEEEEGLGIATARILISQLYRVEADIVFYASPDTMLEISKNSIPAMKTIADFQAAMSSSIAYIRKGEEYTGLDPWYKWMKAFPIGTQGYKMWYMGTHDVNWGDL